MKRFVFVIIVFFSLQQAYCQIGNPFKGDTDVDTLYYVQLDSFSIEARPLKNYNYSRYELIVNKVYPYADTAIMYIRALDQLEFEKRKDEKQYKKALEDKLRTSFEDKLKNLSRSQGEVLIDIIERNTNRSMYDILKDYKSGSSAFFWNSLSKAYGYDLKDRYDANNNPTLENIIVQYEKAHSK